jgi:hypothetical protein
MKLQQAMTPYTKALIASITVIDPTQVMQSAFMPGGIPDPANPPA